MRELFIIARHDTALYEYLVNHFRQNAGVEVILDRREMRDQSVPDTERRHARIDRELKELGFAVVRTVCHRRA